MTTKPFYMDVDLGDASSRAVQPAKRSGNLLWWIIGAGIAALVLVAIFRPQWLGKIGSGVLSATGGIANPYGWV